MTRRGLNRDRAGLTHKVTIGGMSGFITANTYPDGTLAEVFIHGFGVLGSTMQGWADSFAIMLSLSMQTGGDLASLARKFAHKRFDPSGPTDNPAIPTCYSVPDYILRWLALRYGDDALRTELSLIDNEEPLA